MNSGYDKIDPTFYNKGFTLYAKAIKLESIILKDIIETPAIGLFSYFQHVSMYEVVLKF